MKVIVYNGPIGKSCIQIEGCDEFINELPWGIDESLKIDILTKMVLKFNFAMLIPQSKSWERIYV